jgi:hypothetical protein
MHRVGAIFAFNLLFLALKVRGGAQKKIASAML